MEFASRLRIEEKARNISPTHNAEFSFYSKEIKKWKDRILANTEKDLAKYKGLEIGPGIKSAYKLFDADAKGNSGLVSSSCYKRCRLNIC